MPPKEAQFLDDGFELNGLAFLSSTSLQDHQSGDGSFETRPIASTRLRLDRRTVQGECMPQFPLHCHGIRLKSQASCACDGAACIRKELA
jgi:hypothetical protein